ncbi:hypothetical protein ABW20_dc0107668 [Dactylellina cionopaga]|nr:hypothetical protein ABW20_dc0107668 [Dactylellina cionopaga]
MPRLPYVTLDVFTTTPLASGNPLAIVSVPSDVSLSKTQEHQIAREFGYSETVFIYPTDESKPDLTKIAIWTTLQELPFAGHPTVGTGWYLSSLGEQKYRDNFKLLIPAGILSVSEAAGGRVTVDTPHKITLWEDGSAGSSKLSKSRVGEIISLPLTYFENDENKIFAKSCDNGVPVVSIVDGMTFALVEVASTTVLSALGAGRKGVTLDLATDVGGFVPPGGRGLIAVYCYTILEESVAEGKGKVDVRSRMFFYGDQEDPATGSAACALSSYLAITKGSEAEGQRRTVEKVFLEGNAVKVMEGVLTL